MENAIISEIAKAVTKEVSKSITVKDIITLVAGEDGIMPIIGKDFWIANYKVSLKIK